MEVHVLRLLIPIEKKQYSSLQNILVKAMPYYQMTISAYILAIWDNWKRKKDYMS